MRISIKKRKTKEERFQEWLDHPYLAVGRARKIISMYIVGVFCEDSCNKDCLDEIEAQYLELLDKVPYLVSEYGLTRDITKHYNFNNLTPGLRERLREKLGL